MTDLATWLIEHGTSVVTLLGALAAIARARAVRDEAAAKATTIVADALAECEKRSAALEERAAAADARVEEMEGRVAEAEKVSRALDAELKRLIREIHAGAGKD